MATIERRNDTFRVIFYHAGRWVVRHTGDSEAVVHRWRAALRAAWAGGWPAVRRFAPHVTDLIGNPEILYLAAHRLRANGPKAPGAGRQGPPGPAM
jgi:hypothetical protein